MHIVGHLEGLIKNGIDISSQLQEYWNPTKNWNCLEYLGREMIVLKDVSNAAHGDPLTAIMNDRDIYNKLFSQKQIQDRHVNLEDFIEFVPKEEQLPDVDFKSYDSTYSEEKLITPSEIISFEDRSI